MRMKPEIQERMQTMLAEDRAKPRMYWWLSFVDPDRPVGGRNLGCTVVVAGGLAEALAEARLRGANPGGEVQGYSFEDDGSVDPVALEFMLNRLRSRAEMAAHGVAVTANPCLQTGNRADPASGSGRDAVGDWAG